VASQLIERVFEPVWVEPECTRGSVWMTTLSPFVGGITGPAVGAGLPAIVGAFVGQMLILCFIVGVGVRLVRWFRRAMADSERSPNRRPRHTGRKRADDVPLPGRQLRRHDDPAHPLFRGKR
jgi:hypothetical protein